MSGIEITIRLVVVAVLASYLVSKHQQRKRHSPYRYDPAQWTGQAIDVTKLKPRVEEVRRDHLRTRAPAKGLCAHRALLDLARRVVARLAYIQDRESDNHAHPHGPLSRR
jgi:hypothetical protein